MSASVNTNAIFAMREVGDDLQRLRTNAGIRQEDAARKLGVSRFTVSKIERGHAFPTDSQLRILLALYKVSTEERAAVRAKITQGRSYGRAWWEDKRVRTLFKGDSYRYLSLEDAAERVATRAGTYIPGLLQTRGYIEAIAAFGQNHESTDGRETFVETRMKRQEILTRRNPVALDALCLESAVRAVVGGTETMHEQLEHLVACMSWQNVTVRVIPFSAGAPSISSASLTLLDFTGAENGSVVSEERASGESLHQDPAEVRRGRRMLADLAAHALSPEQTLGLIKQMMKELG
ncbi:helix-turn-helix domain-containing protein [Streptomyces xiamenensis]